MKRKGINGNNWGDHMYMWEDKNGELAFSVDSYYTSHISLNVRKVESLRDFLTEWLERDKGNDETGER